MAVVIASSPLSGSMLKSPLRSQRSESLDHLCNNEMYADAQGCVTKWRKDFVSSASFGAHQGLQELSYEREHLKDLQADLASVQRLVEAASQLEGQGSKLADILHDSSGAAGSRAEAIARVSKELNTLCSTRKQELIEEEQKIARQQEVADTQHAAALKLMDTYKDRLGLEITRVAPQTVRMALSVLDDVDPKREFFFVLGLGTQSEGYRVLECEPEVPELPQLLEDLNVNVANAVALPRFVCSMRRAFLKLVKPV